MIADNTRTGSLASIDSAGIEIVAAPDHASSYYARNVGAAHGRHPWLLFIDADCDPAPDLLDAYFDPAPSPEAGAVAGEVVGVGNGLFVRYANARGMLDQDANRRHPFRPTAVTANLLVRREAWQRLGGFQEGIRSGGDGDFCWRLQASGWTLDYQPRASVRHQHRERLGGLLRQTARTARGAAWLNRRYPGSGPRPGLARGLVRSPVGALRWALAGQFERARFKLVDGPVIAATWWGHLGSNAARERPPRGGSIVVMADSFPRISETFIGGEARAIQRLGRNVRIEAITRPERPLLGATRGLDVRYREDDSAISRVLGALRLCVRHPGRALADLRSRRRWHAGGEVPTRLYSVALLAGRLSRGDHLHAHFAGVSALDAMRLHRLLATPYSVTAHAYDIFVSPANLREKLEGADLITTGCDYNVRYLREQFGPEIGARLDKIVMGVDCARFLRRRPLAGGRTVVAVGRLVEKKGFADLIAAAGWLEGEAPLDRLRIVGDGPLREDLARLVEQADLGGKVEFLGALESERVQEVIEGGDLLAMPAVIARNGDRDSMPVVVKEAMALELMVVGTDEVGVPEMIGDDWGRLVPPHDPEALGAAIAELLAQPLESRRAMGAAAREWVCANANVDDETARLVRLIDGAGRAGQATEATAPAGGLRSSTT